MGGGGVTPHSLDSPLPGADKNTPASYVEDGVCAVAKG